MLSEPGKIATGLLDTACLDDIKTLAFIVSQMNLVQKIIRYAEQDRQGLSKLALFLGYSSSDSVRKWIYRNSVPAHQHERVGEFLNGKIKKHNKGKNP